MAPLQHDRSILTVLFSRPLEPRLVILLPKSSTSATSVITASTAHLYVEHFCSHYRDYVITPGGYRTLLYKLVPMKWERQIVIERMNKANMSKGVDKAIHKARGYRDRSC